MKQNQRRSSIFRAFIVILLAITVSSCASSSSRLNPTSYIITPVQDEYTQELIEYIAELQNDGLVTVKEIKVEGSQPFVFLL
jgi:hypothetical protein